ncbi:MAG: hypothetical protein H7Z17_16465 [Fuerstia sp.]|nr:hypothetical protein [Fuerstiella sp.]
MKRLRQIALCGIGISLTCLLLAYLPGLFPIQAPKLTRSSFETIKSGSTLSEITSLLGPPRMRVAKKYVVWVPQEGTLVSAFVSGKEDLQYFPDANKATGYQMVWLDESGLIAGYFGPDDRLQDKYHSTVFVPEGPSLTDWIKTRW